MLRVIGCVTDQHDLWLVLLAGVIGIVSSVTAVVLLGRATDQVGTRRIARIIDASVVGGYGMWSTHFVAMLGFRPGLPFGYDGLATTLSIVVVIGLTGLAYWAALSGAVLVGGIVAGLAIVSMHYVGMAGLLIQAQPHWDAGLVGVSVILAIGFSVFALKLAISGSQQWLKAGCLLALGICCLHFVGMASVTLTPDPSLPVPGASIDSTSVALAVAGMSLLFVGTWIRFCFLDQFMTRRIGADAARMGDYIRELENTQAELRGTTNNLEQSLAEAAKASQVKSQFVATMSHELRTPLNAVIGFSELLSEETFGPLTPVYKDYAMTIRDSGRHLLGIINDVLDVSKLDADKLELREDTVSLELVIDGCFRIMDQHAQTGKVLLISDIEDGLPSLWADEQRVRQVIINLLSNAVKFTLPGGQVRVAAFYQAGLITIRVADNGIGMRTEDIPKALERFGQIDSSLARQTEGTGLGLPLSKRLIELHGGTFLLDSAIGVGTSITITFPTSRVMTDEAPCASAEPLPDHSLIAPVKFAAA